MRRGKYSVLLSSVLLAAAPAPPTSHFLMGRQAFTSGRYELTLHEMMLTLLEQPSNARAREYMRLAGEKLRAADLARANTERRALLAGYSHALEFERRRAAVWTGWVNSARAAGDNGLWAKAYDDAQRVLDENSSHGDAAAQRKRAQLAIARTLAGRNELSQKDWFIYRGLFLLADGQKQPAAAALSSALALTETPGEIETSSVRLYLARVAPQQQVEPGTVPQEIVPVPFQRRVEGTLPRRMARSRPAPPAVAQPGQAAFASGTLKFKAALYEEAIELFERTLSEAPDFAAASTALLRARLALDEQVKARKASAASLYAVGLMLYGQGRRSEAVEHWKRVVTLDPDHGYAERALRHAQQELQEQGR